jgi:hypothetical protein
MNDNPPKLEEHKKSDEQSFPDVRRSFNINQSTGFRNFRKAISLDVPEDVNFMSKISFFC